MEHVFRYRAVDQAGNTSEEGHYEWTATAPVDGPYYEVQLAIPEPGSSYVVWPTPGTAGADLYAAGYRIRSCTHAVAASCSEDGDPKSEGVWSDWDDYEAIEGRSDGITGSPLTPTIQMATGLSKVVSYQVWKVDSNSNVFGSPDLLTAGPWPLDVQLQNITDESETSNLDNDFISEDEDIEVGVEVESGIAGAGIKGVGIVCGGNTKFYDVNGGAVGVDFPCASGSSSGTDLPVHQLGLTLPSVLDFVNVECTGIENEFGSTILSCPDDWTGNLSIANGLLKEYANFPPRAHLFVQLANGDLMLVKDIKIPAIDASAPAPPENVEVGGDLGDDTDPPAIYVDWGAYGDPFGPNENTWANNDNSEGSGISQFALKYRINSGSWSTEVLLSADDVWKFREDMPGLAAEDEVEFSIASIDAVGHRSNATLAEGVVEDLGNSGDTGQAPMSAIDSGVAINSGDDGVAATELYGYWRPKDEPIRDEISITTSLFHDDVDTESPGTPIETHSKTCLDARSCVDSTLLDFRQGSYRTRVELEVVDDTSTVVERTQWSEPMEMDPINPAIDDEVPDRTDIEAFDVTDPDDSGGSVSAQKSKAPDYTKCYKDAKNAPDNSLFNVRRIDPPQFRCRYAYRLTVDGEVLKRVPSKEIVDLGREDAYAPIKKGKYATRLNKKWMQRFSIPVGKKYEARLGYPMFDSFGTTRAWINNDGKYWRLYPVKWEDHPSVAKAGRRIPYKSKQGIPNTKLQGQACYRPKTLKKKPYGFGPNFRQNQVSLFRIDGGAIEYRVRLFMDNRAFVNVSRTKLQKTGITCNQETSGAATEEPVVDAQIGGNSKKDFVFKEGPKFKGKKPKDVGRTYRTYNDRPPFGMRYAFANTNSVSQGGISRGAVPTDESMRFRILGFTGYCDVNAFTKTGPRTDDNTPIKGMRWVYGEYLTDKANGLGPRKDRTGVYSWLPFKSVGLEGLAPDGPDGVADCKYGPQ